MTKRNKIILIVSIVLILILIVILYFYLTQPKAVQPAAAPATNQQPSSGQTNQPTVSGTTQGTVQEIQTPAPALTQTEANMTILASSFAERFGSFSNQSNFANLEDLKILMTDKMSAWADNYIQENRQKSLEIPTEYTGITTKALNAKIVSQTDSSVQIKVATQRREAKGTTADFTVYYQDILINLVKVGDVWKVDGANWQEKK